MSNLETTNVTSEHVCFEGGNDNTSFTVIRSSELCNEIKSELRKKKNVRDEFGENFILCFFLVFMVLRE